MQGESVQKNWGGLVLLCDGVTVHGAICWILAVFRHCEERSNEAISIFECLRLPRPLKKGLAMTQKLGLYPLNGYRAGNLGIHIVSEPQKGQSGLFTMILLTIFGGLSCLILAAHARA